MPVTPRALVSALAALLGSFAAAFVLTDPPGGRWGVQASGRELDRWLTTQPTAVVIGAIVAVAACVALQRSGSRRLAWIVAAGAVAVLALVRQAVPGIAGIDGLITLHLVKCVAAGALLGCAVAAAWGHRGPQLCAVAGTVTGWASVSVFGADIATRSTSVLGEPSRWLLALTLAAAVAAAVTADTTSRITRITAPEAGTALAAIAVIGILNRLLTAWIARDTGESRIHTWVLVGLAMIVVLVATEICARLVARRIGTGDAIILLTATAVAAALMPVLVDLRNPFRDIPAWSAVLVAALAVVAGIALARRLPHPVAGLAVAALVPILGIAWPDLGNHGPWLLVRVGVLAVGAAWAVASALPASPAVAAAGLSIAFVSTVFHAAATVIVPLDEPIRVNFAFVLPEGNDLAVMGLVHYDDRVAGIALTLAVAFCAWGVYGMRARR